MKIEQYLDQMLQKNVFVVIKKHSIVASAFNFIIAASAGVIAILFYNQEPFSLLHFSGMALIGVIYAVNFFFGIDHLQLMIPNASKPFKLYKIDDVFFVGCSMEEAQLFAQLNKKQDIFIEEFENSVYTFE